MHDVFITCIFILSFSPSFVIFILRHGLLSICGLFCIDFSLLSSAIVLWVIVFFPSVNCDFDGLKTSSHLILVTLSLVSSPYEIISILYQEANTDALECLLHFHFPQPLSRHHPLMFTEMRYFFPFNWFFFPVWILKKSCFCTYSPMLLYAFPKSLNIHSWSFQRFLPSLFINTGSDDISVSTKSQLWSSRAVPIH